MATVTKVGAQKWRVRWDEYTNDGKRHTRMKDFSTATAAKQYRAQVETGGVTRLDASIAFSAYAAQWLANREATIEINSRRLYRRAVAVASKYFGVRQLQSIRVSDVESYVRTLATPNNGITARALAHVTITNYLKVLTSLFETALRDELIHKNPTTGVRRTPAPPREKAVLNLDAIRAAVEALKGKPAYVACNLALYGGLRSEECLGLKWSDIDFDAKTLTVRHVRQYAAPDEQLNAHTHYIPGENHQIEKECPKNGKARAFIMPAPLISILKAHQHEQRLNRLKYGLAYHVTDYVCTNANGTLCGSDLLSTAMQGVCTFHQLRHAHISWLLDAGIPVTEVSRRVGHSNTSITLDVYAHASTAQDQQAADALSAL